MENIRAYFINYFKKLSLNEHEIALAKSVEHEGMVNTEEFLKILEKNRMMSYTKVGLLEYDTSSFHNVDPAMFNIQMFDGISYFLKSEQFQILNFGNLITILQDNNQIMQVEFQGRLYKID